MEIELVKLEENEMPEQDPFGDALEQYQMNVMLLVAGTVNESFRLPHTPEFMTAEAKDKYEVLKKDENFRPAVKDIIGAYIALEMQAMEAMAMHGGDLIEPVGANAMSSEELRGLIMNGGH